MFKKREERNSEKKDKIRSSKNGKAKKREIKGRNGGGRYIFLLRGNAIQERKMEIPFFPEDGGKKRRKK